MPMPRRAGYVVATTAIPHNIQKCSIVPNYLSFTSSEESEDGFESLNDAMSALRFHQQGSKEMDALIESHPLFHTAKEEYISLLNIFLPGFQSDEGEVQCRSSSEDPELTEALSTFITLTRRRKNRAEEFFSTLTQFLDEYERAVDELTSITADPVLKGSYLHEKISELKSTVKRKYGAKVEELQKECINKRRRASLPASAKQIFSTWFAEHSDNPYPTDMEKQHLAQLAGVAEAQVSNWFVNVRKRYWKGR